jgi:hypothetical protein
MTFTQLSRRTIISWVRRPGRAIEGEADHLLKVEQRGASGETPFIAILGIILVFIPVFLLVAALSFAAYYLAR